MNEAAFTPNETPPTGNHEAMKAVTDRVEELLDSLEEALENYSEVTLPCGETVDAETRCEQVVARAQVLLAALEGLREQKREANDAVGEKAAAQLVDVVAQLEGFLKVRADIHNEAEHSEEAARLAEVVDSIALQLMPQAAANDAEYGENKEAA